MTLRLVQVGNALPVSFIVDPSTQFMPGMIAQLTVQNNQVVATLSNGTAPIGIIDDIKTKAFTNISWNEEVKVMSAGVIGPNNTLVTPVDVKVELKKANIVPASFVSTIDCLLNPVNGVVTFPAGTPLNYDAIGGGSPNAIRAFANYTYYVPNIPGDDSTLASGRITIWYNRMFFQTDQFETNQNYPLGGNLFVSEVGMLTSRRPSKIHPAIGIITAPPTALQRMLECMWY